MTDLAALRAALVERADEVAIALLGEPNRAMSSLQELRFGRKGSMAVAISGPKAGIWFDHEAREGGDLLGLIRRGCGGGFREAMLLGGRFVRSLPVQPASRPPIGDNADGRERKQQRNKQYAHHLWGEGVPINDTLAARYLERRGVLLPALQAGDEVLRFHRRCPFGEDNLPCLIALVRDIATDAPCAIYRTALTRRGEKIGRMALGPKKGGVVKLSRDEDVSHGLTVGEGVETTLSGRALGFHPAWALGDSGNLRAFPVLPGIEVLTILVDHDEAGQCAASACMDRWTIAGREVHRVVPRRAGMDFNDLLRGQ
jgi:Toprim domain